MNTLTRWAVTGTAAFCLAAVTLAAGCTAESEPTAAESTDDASAESAATPTETAAAGTAEAPAADEPSPEERARREALLAAANARVRNADGAGERGDAPSAVEFGSDGRSGVSPEAGAIDPERAAPASKPNSFMSAANPREQKELDAARTLEEAREREIRAAEKARIASGDVATGGARIEIEPAVLELGEIPTGSSGTGVVRLTNRGDAPVTMLDCKSSCGCTTANCSKNKELLPGDFTEVEIKLDGGAQARKIEKSVTFMMSDNHPPVRVTVRGESIAFVQAEPERLDPSVHPDGKLTLRSVDGEPFVVRSSFPAVLDDQLPTEAAEEHTFYISWDAIKDGNHRTRRMLFRVDHPKADRVMVNMNVGSLFPRVAAGSETAAPPAPGQPRVPSQDGVPVLDRVLNAGDIDEALRMLEAGEITLNVKDAAGQTALIKAARWGAPAVIDAMVARGSNVEAEDTLGRTPLMYACQSKNLDAVIALLDAGADVGKQDRLGNNAASWAAGFGTPEILREVLDAGAPVEVSGELIGFTPLIWAAGFGEPESVQMLVDAGANLEARDTREGLTVFLHAARTGKNGNLRVLADAGADLAATSNVGRSAYLVAARNTGVTVTTLQILEELGLAVDAVDNEGRNALDLAMSRNDGEARAVIAYLNQRLGSSDDEGEDGDG